MTNQSIEDERRLNTSETKLPRLSFLVCTTQEHQIWKNNASQLQNHQE